MHRCCHLATTRGDAMHHARRPSARRGAELAQLANLNLAVAPTSPTLRSHICETPFADEKWRANDSFLAATRRVPGCECLRPHPGTRHVTTPRRPQTPMPAPGMSTRPPPPGFTPRPHPALTPRPTAVRPLTSACGVHAPTTAPPGSRHVTTPRPASTSANARAWRVHPPPPPGFTPRPTAVRPPAPACGVHARERPCPGVSTPHAPPPSDPPPPRTPVPVMLTAPPSSCHAPTAVRPPAPCVVSTPANARARERPCAPGVQAHLPGPHLPHGLQYARTGMCGLRPQRANVYTHPHAHTGAPACTHWRTRMHTPAPACTHLRRAPARTAQHVRKHPCLACPRPPWLYAMLPPGSPRAAFASPLTSRHAPTQLPTRSVCIARPPVHARA
ncbi:hypothetical protein GGX14DRAFT_561630 [Mycena pura]|uniref:Uncharacterized protein n=1 Tax=Mycena pura TaxID=153505 RepID=A0AAD6VQA7_9AGAR|nr:hypothetical protein GGX14DRAFT_561630 [Mycena pura]